MITKKQQKAIELMFEGNLSQIEISSQLNINSVTLSRWKHKKTTSVEGTGTLGGYLVTSNWMKYALPYIQGGKDLYFDATLTINDPTSKAGTQTVLIKDINLDDIPIADFEADDGVMEWESDFTFEGIDLVSAFTGFDL